MAYRMGFFYALPSLADQRRLETWLCYFLYSGLPKSVHREFVERDDGLRVYLTWPEEDAFRAWLTGDDRRQFIQDHDVRRHWLPRPQLLVPRKLHRGPQSALWAPRP